MVEFQRRVVHLATPDGRVDPGGKTWVALEQGGAPAAAGATWTVTFQHQNKTPEAKSATKGTDALYESIVTVSGVKSGKFRGSIFPDNMAVKGRAKDGKYDLYLGFHSRDNGNAVAKASDLVVRTEGFRATLIVNNDKAVPVSSNNAAKKTSTTVHVHNGFRGKRYSDGCPTIHPDDWAGFIKLFLDAYPEFASWTATNRYVGKKIGLLEVKA
jgi:hypothetical protein